MLQILNPPKQELHSSIGDNRVVFRPDGWVDIDVFSVLKGDFPCARYDQRRDVFVAYSHTRPAEGIEDLDMVRKAAVEHRLFVGTEKWGYFPR